MERRGRTDEELLELADACRYSSDGHRVQAVQSAGDEARARANGHDESAEMHERDRKTYTAKAANAKRTEAQYRELAGDLGHAQLNHAQADQLLGTL